MEVKQSQDIEIHPLLLTGIEASTPVTRSAARSLIMGLDLFDCLKWSLPDDRRTDSSACVTGTQAVTAITDSAPRL